MGRIDVILPDELEKRVRMEMAKRKGMKKGRIKEAIIEAMLLWINKSDENVEEKSRKKE